MNRISGEWYSNAQYGKKLNKYVVVFDDDISSTASPCPLCVWASDPKDAQRKARKYVEDNTGLTPFKTITTPIFKPTFKADEEEIAAVVGTLSPRFRAY